MNERTLQSLPPTPGRTGWPFTEASPPLPERTTPWPRITVVTPSFKQGPFIEETIRSVLLQGYPNLQYLVMDGGSPDETKAVLEKYAPWLDFWVSERDDGQTHAINKGLERADGDYFAWLNSDDVYEPGALAAMVQALEASPGARLVCGACTWFDANGYRDVRPSRPDAPFAQWLMTSPLQQPASMWARSLHTELGPLDPSLRYVMDQELFARFRAQQVPMVASSTPFARLRLHAASKTVSTENRFRWETLQKIVPRYERHVPGSERGVLARGIVEKALRIARAELRDRHFMPAATAVAHAARTSARETAKQGVGFVVRSVR